MMKIVHPVKLLLFITWCCIHESVYAAFVPTRVYHTRKCQTRWLPPRTLTFSSSSLRNSIDSDTSSSTTTTIENPAQDNIINENKKSIQPPNTVETNTKRRNKLEGKLLKQLRQVSLKYQIIENNDHIMCCISGGKDSATLLHLLLKLQTKLAPQINFRITAVHLNQMQPGYNGTKLYEWLDTMNVPYKIVDEDTYTIVKDKTPENKTYCSLCSRLRRGILYTVADDIGANKLALGHHGDDAIETLLLNLIHNGQMKGMPARYYSKDRDMHVVRPLMHSLEEDIAEFASLMEFPILPCNLCGTQPAAQRAKVKMLCHSLMMLNPNAKKNMITAMGDVRPSHLLDMGLREACGLDRVTGEVQDERAHLIRGYEDKEDKGAGQQSGDVLPVDIEELY